jgi:hypothetical protein
MNNIPNEAFKAPKKEFFVGDFDLFLRIKESKFWRYLFTNFDKALGILIIGYFLLSKAIVNHAFVTLVRTNPGIRQSGLIALILSILFLLSLNTEHLHSIIKGLGMLILPIVCSWKDWEEIKTMVWIDTHSKSLKIYTIIMVCLSTFYTVRVHLGFGNKDISSRGDSWLFLGLKFLIKKSKFRKIQLHQLKLIIEAVVEPAIFLIIGILNYQNDAVFSVFLLAMAASEISIQFINKCHRLKHQAILNR